MTNEPTATEGVSRERKAAGAAAARLLRAKDMTPERAAQILGVTDQTLAFWASGVQFPPKSKSKKIVADVAAFLSTLGKA